MIACAAPVELAFVLCVVAALIVFAVAVLLDRRPRPDAGRPVTPTSPMWPKATARPAPSSRVTGSPQSGALSPRATPTRPPAQSKLVPVTGIGVNDVSTGPEDLGPYVGGPPVAPRHQARTAVTRPGRDLPVRHDW